LLLDAIDGLTIDAASTGTILDIASGTVLINGFFTFTGGAGGNGGAIHNAGTLDLAYSTVTGSAATAGAGLYNEGTATVRHTTFSHNQASGDGGGIYNTGTLTIVNSTIAANAAGGNGGGISNTGTLTLTNVTISGNSAGQFGGGIEASGTETVVNTIVAGNTDTHTDADVTGAVDTSTTSVVGIPGGKTLADILDPAGLQAHDGVNDTIALALVAGNPAVDAGTQSVCDGDAVHGDDQRGFPRSATQCDIGAYEAQLPGVQAPPAIFVPATSDAGAVVNFASQVTGSDEAGNALPVVCVPPSGSTFPADTSTRVNCSTTDALGHTGTSGFNVVVGVAPISDTALPAERGSATMVLYLLGLLGLLGLISIAPVLDRRLRH